MDTAAPHAALAGCVARYWRSLGNRDSQYLQLPDGCVDVVLEQTGDTLITHVYGTSTGPRQVPLRVGADYFGIRFWPGQARHALPLPICALTDARVPLPDILTVRPPAGLLLVSDTATRKIDAWLGAWLEPRMRGHVADAVDAAIARMHRQELSPSIAAMARQAGLSTRQFERRFLAATGVPPSVFAAIVRFQRARARLRQQHAALTAIAHDCGYSDQSHFHRDFRRFTGHTPGQWRAHVASVQDHSVTAA